jgi:hypothetical protein
MLRKYVSDVHALQIALRTDSTDGTLGNTMNSTTALNDSTRHGLYYMHGQPGLLKLHN